MREDLNLRSLYFRFLQFSLGLCDGTEFLSGKALKDFDWNKFYTFATKQTLTGVLFDGIKRLPKEAAPPQKLLFRWLCESEALRRRNMVMNRATAYVYNKVSTAGYRPCILKGQGNALMYPNPNARTPGDVDVWVSASRAEIRKLASLLTAEGNGVIGEESLNHIEMVVKGIAVELHSTPAIMNNPVHNHRLQAWLRRNADAQCGNVVALNGDAGRVAVPTSAFNAIYQLFHLYHHYFYEGVGLRQVVDYYYVMLNVEREIMNCELQRDLKRLGLWRFAGAMMYVLREVMDLPAERMIAPVDEKRGVSLLEEILSGGNFGKYDSNHKDSVVGHNIQRLLRDLRLMRYYPSEALTEPIFRAGHFLWRKKNKE